MLEEGDQLTRLGESLLTLSRDDAGHIKLERMDRSLLALTGEASSIVEVLAEEKGQRIEIDGDASLIVSGDCLILRQAIVNLLDNAIKYSPENRRVLVRVGFGAAGKASMDITDEGSGIPSEHQPYVFDRFYRVDPARTREWGGAGLGLAITRWAIEAHGGEIYVTSKDDAGTTCHVSLPPAPKSLPHTTASPC